MAHVKLQDGGWCALPESLRQKLDLKTGQAFEVELVVGTIVLKRAETTRAREALPAVADEKLSGPIVDPALAAPRAPDTRTQAEGGTARKYFPIYSGWGRPRGTRITLGFPQASQPNCPIIR